MPTTRRALLSAMARLGGAGAVADTLAAWEFLRPAPAMAAGLTLPADAGKGKTVAILGAGVSGLCAAYELDRAGYQCVILEPQQRAGGRSLTLRRGDTFKEMGDSPLQRCEFDEGLYLNFGPGRIAHWHVRVIGYCRKFGVSLQPYIFASRANLVHSSTLGNGRTVPIRQALYDLQGAVAEIAEKCISSSDLNAPVAAGELQALREMLAKFGDLTKVERAGSAPTWSYQNKSGRAGYERLPGYGDDAGRPLSPLKLDELLRSKVWDNWIFRDAEAYWQTSLLQPVGGMDRFAQSFLRQPLQTKVGNLDGLIRHGVKALEIDIRSDKVAVLCDDAGARRVFEADYCISTIPTPIFKRMKVNLPPSVMRAAEELPILAAGKVGWQAERFWERENNIYGGISWTTDTIDQIWYPSADFLSAKGALTGAYLRGPRAVEFDLLPIPERLRIAKEQGERLHPGQFARHVEHGLVIGWERMEFAEGGWAHETNPNFGRNAGILAGVQARFKIAGDQITFLSGWQEGAVLAAWEAVQAIDRHANPTISRQ